MACAPVPCRCLGIQSGTTHDASTTLKNLKDEVRSKILNQSDRVSRRTLHRSEAMNLDHPRALQPSRVDRGT